MSLIHWWPLNGNTTDLGISPCTVTGTPTFNAAGKIGQCLSGGALTMPAAATAQVFNKDAVSVCFWLYNGGSAGCIFGTDPMTPPNNRRFTLFQYPTTNDLHWSWQNEDSGGTFTSGVANGAIPSNVWTHICAVWDHGTARIYANGTQVGTSTGTCTSINWAYDTVIARPSSTRYYNDIRIYNHALSVKEVKEISKGLMLHYNFEDNCQQLINAYAEPTFNTSASNGGWGHWGSTGHAGSYAQNTDTNYIYPGFSAYSHKVANGSNATKDYLLYQEKLFDGGYRSMQAIIKASDGAAITNSVCYPDWNGRNGGVASGSWTSIESIGNGFYLCKVEGIKQTTSPGSKNAHLVGIYVKAGKTIYVTCCYLENGKQLCSDIFDPNPKCYDCSGYGYNGTISGNIQLSSDSAAGKHSIYSPAGDNYVERQNFPVAGFNADQQFTINAWIKIVGYVESTSWNTIFRLAATNARDQQLHFCYNSSGNIILSQYSDDPQFTLNVPLNTWAMVTWVHYKENSTAKCKYFVNGQQVGSTQSYSGLLNIKDNARLNLFYDSIRRDYASNLYMGDFKIYSTALSAEDILAEYNRKAAIDKKGNLFTGEFIETNTNANIADKNNQIKATYFVEGKDTIKIFGGYTELDYFDQINPAAGATSQHNRCTISDISYDHIEARVNVTGQGSSGGIVFSNGMWWKTYTGRGNVNDGSGTVTMTPASFSQNVWTDVNWDFSKVFSGLWTSGWSDGINYWTPQNLKVAYIKTYIGSELTGHFIPVKNKNNVIGLFNLITNKFYSNTGTGTESFVAGNSLGKLSLIQENKIEEL